MSPSRRTQIDSILTWTKANAVALSLLASVVSVVFVFGGERNSALLNIAGSQKDITELRSEVDTIKQDAKKSDITLAKISDDVSWITTVMGKPVLAPPPTQKAP